MSCSRGSELREAGVGLWVPPEPVSRRSLAQAGDSGEAVADLQAKTPPLTATALGMEPQFDEVTEAVVPAFQRHFRPARVDGIADPLDDCHARQAACRAAGQP